MRRNSPPRTEPSSTWMIAITSLILVIAGCLIPARAPAELTPPALAPARILDEPPLLAPPGPAPLLAADAPASIPELRARVAAILTREQVPGAGLALVERRGLIWAGGVGLAELDGATPVDADTVFRVASITKSVVALGVMRFVERGELELDEPLRARMPEIELTNGWADEAPITLAHALEHSAGFDDIRFNEWWAPEGTRPREALAINPRSRVARWRPGSRMSYSNPGYTIAGHALELASGEAWDRVLTREVLIPLGMGAASFERTPGRAAKLATGYRGPGEAAPFEPLAHAPAGALLASPRELAQLVSFWLRRGQLGGEPILSPASLARVEQTATLPYPTTDTNYGLGNYGDVAHGVRGRGHDGGLPGFLSCYRYFPELGVGYVMLLNGTHSARAYAEIRALLFAYLARGRELPTPPRAPPDDEAIAAAAGYYGFANPRNELLAFVERAVLGVELRRAGEGVELELLTGGRVAMIPTGEGGFRHRSEGGTSVRVTTGVDGQRILLAGMAYFEASSGTWARARLAALRAALICMQLALLWAVGWGLVALVQRLRGATIDARARRMCLGAGLATLSFYAMIALALQVSARAAFCTANPLSVGLCAMTLVFPACAARALVLALRARGCSIWLRAIPSLGALSCFAIALWLTFNGVVGLRVWAW